jgi:ketosteroid isomerase-like protein
MSTVEIAKKYVELCRAQQHHVILETAAMPGQPAESRGLAAVVEKGKRWQSDHEVHGAKVEGPWPNGQRFIVRFGYDVTNKPSGKRFQMEEAALFTVDNGKIVREEFFYSTEG